MTEYIGLDFETFSEVNLKVHGLERYASDPSFRPILASVAYQGGATHRYDFVRDGYDTFIRTIQDILDRGALIVAQNAGFERRVLAWLGFEGFEERVVDSAVMARALGAGSALIVASRQLTNSHKLEEGAGLIQKFCIPHEGYDAPSQAYNEANAEDWNLFGYYCDIDAEGGLNIVLEGLKILLSLNALYLWDREYQYEWLTAAQNRAGWQVDLNSVRWMHKRAWANSQIAKAVFLQSVDEDLNFNSPVQLKKFCAERGVKVTSLDKYQAPVVLENTRAKLEAATDEETRKQLQEVVTMLEIKLEIGGSTLKKLPVILNHTAEDGKLRDQYVHVGAGQTFRTTGRAVQMQNLARLGKDLRDLSTLEDYSVEWTNEHMASQLRQVFTSEHSDGLLFVGDFSAVESRGLAYLADEEWKLDVFRSGLDVYKMLVTKYDNISYEEVTDELRPKGKYSELSCGYQASAEAVKEYMFRLGFVITLEEAQEWVTSWRGACPKIVHFWHQLDDLLQYVVRAQVKSSFFSERGLEFRITPFKISSVSKVHPGSTSLCIQIFLPGDPEAVVTRFVHGAYLVGRGIAYYKATESLGEKGLWSNINETATQKANKGRKAGQKKRVVLNTIYGGKLAGILTQSLCRELFFMSIKVLAERLAGIPNVRIVGQFHDEVIVDWIPSTEEGALSKEGLKKTMEEVMSMDYLPGFPLVAEIKNGHRYIK